MAKAPNWFTNFVKEARKRGEIKEVRVNLKALEAAPSKDVNLSGAKVVASAATPELLAGASEGEWQRVVTEFARANGWTPYHTMDSRGSDPGFLDSWLIREGKCGVWLYVAELKDADGRETPEQREWARMLKVLADSVPASSGCRFRIFLWRPEDWPVVKELLSEPME